MRFSFTLRRSHLKVFSAVCANFVVVWLVAALTATDVFVLTRNIIAAILAWYAAVAAEKSLENE